MTTLLKSNAPGESKTRPERVTDDNQVCEQIRQRINGCPYHFVFSKITWHYEQGRLTFHGCVPSFYLKQVLQELVRGIDEVKRIANQVDVVSASGLSSEPQERRR